MTATFAPLIVGLLLLPLEAALLPFVGLSTARADVVLCAVVFLAVGGAATLWSAAASFLLGLVADLLTPVHPGLFALTALLVFMLVRLSPLGREVRGAVSFAVVVALASAVQQLVALGLLSLVGQKIPRAYGWPLAQSVLLTTLVAPGFHWLATQLDRGLTREDTSLLR